MASMAPVQRPVPLTYDDYCRLPDEGVRYELIEGELFVSPSPSTIHQTVSRRLQYALMSQLEIPGHAAVFNAPMDVILEPTSVVQPDLFIVGTDRRHLITKRATEGAPHVVIELVSTGSLDRDRFIKRRLYQRFAIPEYWVVDPEQGTLVVWRMTPDGYGTRAQLDHSSTLTSPDFPMLEVPLRPIFTQL